MSTDTEKTPTSAVLDPISRLMASAGPAEDAFRRLRDLATTQAEAIRHVLNRAQTDPDFRYLMLQTESMGRLCAAEAQLTGRPLADVEAERSRDLQPAHRRREPEVLVLRRELEAPR